MMIKKYINYNLKVYAKPFLVIFILSFIFFPIIALINKIYFYAYPSSQIADYTASSLYLGTILFCFASYFLPMFIRKKFYNHEACDTYLSLPLEKEKISLIDNLMGYASIVISFIVLTLVVALINLIKGLTPPFYLYLDYILGAIFAITLMYGISAFISSISNNLLDAFILNCIVILISFILCAYIYVFSYRISLRQIVSPILISDGFTTIIETAIVTNLSIVPIEYDIAINIALIIDFVLGCALIYLSFLQTKHFKSENTNEESTYIYSYKLLVPLFTALLNGYIIFTFYPLITIVIVLMIIILILHLTLIFVFKRKIIFDKYVIISTISSLCTSIILGVIFYIIQYA